MEKSEKFFRTAIKLIWVSLATGVIMILAGIIANLTV
jgi:hypothetical protein